MIEAAGNIYLQIQGQACPGGDRDTQREREKTILVRFEIELLQEECICKSENCKQNIFGLKPNKCDLYIFIYIYKETVQINSQSVNI